MRLTDHEVALLYRHAEGERREMWGRELRSRTRSALIESLPSPTGTCQHGRRIQLDDKGAYSSGYWYHTDGDRSTCFEGPAVLDPDSDETAATKSLLKVLR